MEYVIGGILIVALIIAAALAMIFRRVVPTNMVHIAQSAKKTVAYGRGKDAGNSYYEWPSFVPLIGVEVTQFPESIFKIDLKDYEAYDEHRLPFVVDVAAFFRVDSAETAAQRVSSFNELAAQLVSVLQGAVRRILATNKLEDIMKERSALGDQFTSEVKRQIAEWGVLPVKTIEFMDIRDSKDSQVIRNIMAKESSRIEKESRISVAQNIQDAQLKEIDTQRTVDVQKQHAEQQVGIRTAEKDKAIGIAREQSNQEVQVQRKITTEREMDVQQVTDVREAEIKRDVAVVSADQQAKVDIIQADASKTTAITTSQGVLESEKLKADGIRAVGLANADAEKAMLMAPVDTQITLAKEIGENEGYQQYLITIEQVRAGQVVGVEMAKAMGNADLKVIANAGSMQEGVASIGDVFSTAGGTKLSGMLTALAATPEGKAVVDKLTAIVPAPKK